ncbi:MAG: hypothetical protein JNL90_02060 [Planctomycetes bacterium]|nr:hypothetical protein [Planctomycetota bacterium]
MRRGVLPLVMALAATGAVLLRAPLAEANAGRRLPGTSFVPRPALAKLLSAGHRSTLSDLLWLSAIGDLSRDFSDPQRKLAWLDSVFTTIPLLEPSFATVYSFGATYLTMIERHPDRAIELLEEGVAKNPDDLRLAVELAMAVYTHHKDRERTLAILEPVVKDPSCDALTMGFYSSLLVDGRQDYAALAQWAGYLDHSNELVRETAALQIERAKRRIALRAIEEFKATVQRPPLTADELRRPGLMAPEVVDPVVASLWIDPALRPRFEKCDELERRNSLRGASRWVVQFRAENGRSPTLDELLQNPWVRLPPPPRGQHYDLAGDDVVLVDDAR